MGKEEEKDVPQAEHLEVKPYDEKDRVEPPDWYDDTINVGDAVND